jgi:hypothetical protein
MHIEDGKKFTDYFKVGDTVFYQYFHNCNRRYNDQPDAYTILKVTAKQMKVVEQIAEGYVSTWTISSNHAGDVWPTLLDWKKERLAWLIKHRQNLEESLAECREKIDSCSMALINEIMLGGQS